MTAADRASPDEALGVACTYTVLRYVHDIVTAEFINVGVVVAGCDAPLIAAKFRTAHGRVKAAFPSLDVDLFIARMMRLQACFDGLSPDGCAELWMRNGAAIEKLVQQVLPLEDKALHWSPVGSSVGGSIATIRQHLYERLVLRHDLQRRDF